MEIWKPDGTGEAWVKTPFLPFPLPEGQDLRSALIGQSHRDESSHFVVFTPEEETVLAVHVRAAFSGMLPEIVDEVDFFLREVVGCSQIGGKFRAFPFTLNQDSPNFPGKESVLQRCFWVNRQGPIGSIT